MISRYRRFAIFFTSHSDPDHGDIHYLPNRGAATLLSQVCLPCLVLLLPGL